MKRNIVPLLIGLFFIGSIVYFASCSDETNSFFLSSDNSKLKTNSKNSDNNPMSTKGCKYKICSCCGDSGRTFIMYHLDGTQYSSFVTGSGGCIDGGPSGPFTVGDTYYFVDQTNCGQIPPKTYFTATCCHNPNFVDTIKILCCDGN